MATATLAPQTDGANASAPAHASTVPGERKANREVPGYRVGDCTVIRDRGYDPIMAEIIFERDDWIVTSVYENEMVGINGVRMVVEGPKNDEAYEMVSLPRPVALILKEKAERLREARNEWRKRTAKALGGTLETEQR
jgi:hypothetical protein